MGKLAADRHGGVSLILAGVLALGACLAAFAVDMGAVYLDGRRLQGVADAAALAAAGDPDQATARANATITASGWAGAALVGVETGTYARDPSLAPEARFAVGGTRRDAARAAVSAAVPLHFAAMFGRDSLVLTRRATAARTPVAAFSIGSRLAALDGGVANALTSALLGGTVSLSVADYRALADAQIDLFQTADALRTRLALTGATYDTVLATQTTLPMILHAAADALTTRGATGAATAARSLASAAPARAMSAAALFDPGQLGTRTTAGGLRARASAWDLIQSAIGVSGGRRQVAVSLGVTVPGLASTTLYVATGERPASSPWMAVAADGSQIVRTAQTRIHLDTRIGITGLAGIASLHVPLTVELAEAQAHISTLSCAASGGGVTLAVTPAVGHASIARIDTAQLHVFTAPLTEQTATLANVGVVTINANIRLPLGGGAARDVAFSTADIAAGATRTVSTDNLVGGLAAGLVARPGLTVSIWPLNIGAGLVQGLVNVALSAAAPLLDTALNTALSLTGLHVGQADVTVGGLRCGHAALVA